MKSKIFNTNLVYFISMTLFVLVRILTLLGVFNFFGDYASYILNIIIQVGIIFLLPLFLLTKLNKQKAKSLFKEYSFNKISAKEVVISILIGLIVFILNIFFSVFINYILALIGYNQGTSVSSGGSASILSLILSLIMTAVLPAFCEEFLHRGVLVSSYKKLGFKNAILISSLLFGLLHMNIEQFLFATMVGLILGSVTLFSRSIVPAMIIHFMNNGINVYLGFAKANNMPSYQLYNKFISIFFGGNLITSVLLVALLIPLLILALLALLKTLLKINTQKSIGSFVNLIALNEMRRETLGDIANQQAYGKNEIEFMEMMKGNRNPENTKIEIPYEVLGFYMLPVKKQTFREKTFLISSLILGSLVTFFTLIWGMI